MKIASYATMHLGVAFATAWALTGDLRIAGAIALVEPAVQTVAYAVHERVWQGRGVRVGRGHGGRAAPGGAPPGVRCTGAGPELAGTDGRCAPAAAA